MQCYNIIMKARPKLHQNEALYKDAAKVIVRAVLMGAPRSVIDQYQKNLYPFSLDSTQYGIDDKRIKFLNFLPNRTEGVGLF